jgi:hypothetical protein
VKRFLVATGVVACIVVLSACTSLPSAIETPAAIEIDATSEAKASIAEESSAGPTSSPIPSIIRTEVMWADYDPGTQAEIDQMTNAGDCVGINSYFGMATATEESVKARTGHGNEALTKYLNESLALAQCN